MSDSLLSSGRRLLWGLVYPRQGQGRNGSKRGRACCVWGGFERPKGYGRRICGFSLCFFHERTGIPPSLFPFMVCVRWVTVCWPLTSRRGPSNLATRFLPALPCCVACGREWGGGFYMECIEPACDNYQRMSGLYVPGRSSKRTGLFPTAPGRVCRESPQCPCL